MDQKENTVMTFLNFLKESGIAYGIMRNYEQLPSTGNDIDFVAYSNDISKIQNLLVQTAKIESWDLLTRLSYHSSIVHSRHVDVYRYYDLKKLQCLHIDFFHGMTSYGLEILAESELMNDLKANDWFVTISDVNENLIRWLQIGNLYEGSKTPKINKYLNKIQSLDGKQMLALKIKLIEKFGNKSLVGLDALINEDMDLSVKIIYSSKLNALFSAFLTKPFNTIKNFFIRLYEIFNQTFFNYAGLTIFIETENNAQLTRKIDKAALNLINGDIFKNYLIEEKSSYWFSYKRLKLRKEFGLLIQYGPKYNNLTNILYNLVISNESAKDLNDYEISRIILNKMLQKQSFLYQSEEV